MKNIIHLKVIVVLFSFFYSFNTYSQACGCTNCPVAITDNGNFDAIIFIQNTGPNILGGNNCLESVCFTVNHPWIGDLDFTLTAPDGTCYLIMADSDNGSGGCGTNCDNINVCIQVGTGNPAGTGSSEYGSLNSSGGNCVAGNYTMATSVTNPNGSACNASANNLDVFNNGSGTVSGTWTLTIGDNCALDQGALTDWSLNFCDESGINCSSTPLCNINNFTANISACNSGTYDISGFLEYINQPATGTLIIEDCFGTQHVVASAPFPGSAVLNYNINGMPADGAPCDLVAYFSADPACIIGPINYTAPVCSCSFTNIEGSMTACDPSDNTFDITGLVEFTNPPSTGTLTISDCNGNSQVFNPPFNSPTNFSLLGIDSDGTTNCMITATFSADPACTIDVGPYDNPSGCVCDADIGTFNNQFFGDAISSNPWSLCFGDELDIIGNSDFIPSEDFSVAGATYDPGVWLLAYDCPPTVLEPNDILTDPCFLGVASSADQAWGIVNSTGDGSTVYFVPVTMYSMVDGIYAISINAGAWCYDLGPVYPVTFLPEITAPFTQDCQNGTATVTITGGDPAVNGTQFTASNLLPATASFSSPTANNGGTITVTGLQDGDNWSFDISDVNGCPISVSGSFTGVEDPSFTYPNNTYCQDQADPSANITGTTGGSFTSSPAGLVINAGTGIIDLSASTPGAYTITYTTPDPTCFDQTTYNITINGVPNIVTPPNVNECGQYILPAITGTNLTGNESYYTGPGASGTQMNSGDVISTIGTTTLYIYDETGTVPNCSDETSFDVTIIPGMTDITCPGPLLATCNISEHPPYADYNAFIAAGGSVTIDPLGNIDPSTFNLVSELSDGNTCPEVITRTYEVGDECGTLMSCTQTITINDDINPTGSAPPNISITAGTPIPAADELLITNEADNCGVPSVLWTGDISDGGNCPEIITRTYRIEDACGNFIDVSHTITIGDALIPTASNPATINVECIGDVPLPDPLVVTDEADNNGTPAVAWEDDNSDGASCPETISRRYRVTDNCGNFIFVTQSIIVQDITDPVLNPAPANITVDCSADVPAMTTIDWTDNCDGAGNVLGNDVSDGNTCPEVITRTWTYTDDCGNSATVSQTITVHDLTAPVFDPTPANMSVQCVDDIPAMTDLNWTDNCDGAGSVTGIDGALAGGSCGGTITRTWTYTDACGNNATVNQTFTVDDTTPPTASNPAPISVPSSADVPAPNIAVVTDEADNCTTNPIVTWVSDLSDGNVCNNEIITRTFSIVDDCGNEIFVTQEITILAVPAPIDAGPDVLICEGASTTLIADNPWNVSISWNNGIQNGVPFGPNSTTTYTVTADNFGCISTDDVIVSVESLPIVDFSGDILSGCEPLTTVFTNNSVGGSPFVDCVWQFSNGVTITGCNQVTNTFVNSGTYDVTLTSTTVNGCTNSTTYSNYIYVEAIPDAEFTPSPSTMSTIYTVVNFTNSSTNAVNYSWDFGDGYGSNDVNPSHTFPSDEPGSYIIELIAVSPLGCSDTAYRTITIEEEEIFYVPNTFTPDGDSYNENFKAVFYSGYDPFNYTMLIFNRWGEVIWESHDYSVGWNGTYGGKIVPDGVYTWKIEVKTTATDERRLFTGHVNVVR